MSGASLRVDVRTSGIWQTNSVVLSDAGEAVVSDPAFFPRELDELATLVSRRAEQVTVVFTHGHWDHVAGWRHFPGARVCGSVALAEAVAADAAQARDNLAQLLDFEGRWYVPRPAPASWPPRIEALADGARLRVGAAQLEVLALPGHSSDGLGLWLEAEGLLLPGDYLSPCEIPFVEDLRAYRATLERLRALLPRARRIVPGHGPELDADRALAIAAADVAYLDALADRATRGDATGALALTLPRAADAPGMTQSHRKNCRAVGLAIESPDP